MSEFTARDDLPTKCIFVFCLSENKQRLFHCTALRDCFYNLDGVSLLRGAFCPHCVFMCFYNRGVVFTARYVLPELCIFCGYEIKQRLFHSSALSDCFYNRDGVCLLRGTFCPHSVLMCSYNRGG
jgi:hypothetical protein